MGRPKLSLALAPGEPLGGVALRAMLTCGRLAEVTVVARPEDPLDWLVHGSGTASVEAGTKLRVVRCPDARLGMSRSIRCGLEAAAGSGVPDAAFIVLADQPFVSAALLRRIAAAYDKEGAADFAAYWADGSWRPPVLLGASMFEAVLALTGDTGARDLLRDSAYRGIAVTDNEPRTFLDIDTLEDWARARAEWPTFAGVHGAS